MKKLLWRCDDFGSAAGANAAILALAEQGLSINVSVLVCGPAAQRGLDELAGLGYHVCLGIHAAIHAEWDGVKWGPVCQAIRASPLVNPQGYFHAGYSEAHPIPVEIIAAEIAAQIEKAQSWGVAFSYLDEHMGFGWLPGVAESLAKLAAVHGLVYRRELPGLPGTNEPVVDLVERTARQLHGVTDDAPHLAVFHPARDDASTRQYYNAQIRPGIVGRERQKEFEALASPRWRQLMNQDGIQLMTYRELSHPTPSLA